MEPCKNVYCYDNCDAYEAFCANTEDGEFDPTKCKTRQKYEKSCFAERQRWKAAFEDLNKENEE